MAIKPLHFLLSLSLLAISTGNGFAKPTTHPGYKLFSTQSKKVQKSFLVVIDPGHGGSELGATKKIGKKLYKEKDLTLILARSISEALKKRRIQAVLTRETDKDLPLAERTRIANQMGADVFISIHMNSHHPQQLASLGGIETFILNRTTNEASQRLAKFENSVLDGSVVDHFHEKTDVALIVKDLLLDANLESSKHLACLVQKRIVKSTLQYLPKKLRKKKNRGVKQALFYVLLGADMPSILLEAGFINNRADRRMVLNKHQRKVVAASVASAIDRYRKEAGTTKAAKTLSTCQVH